MATLKLISDFVGKTIVNWYVVEKIGEGGYGIVYRAKHVTLDDREAAIKLLKPEALHDPTLIERFRNEARAAARIKHPGIVRIDDIGVHTETGAHYIIMEYLRGTDLQQWLAPHREGLPLAEVLALLYDVADALDAVHDQGIIHRDLKPENLFRREDGLVKLLDLGIAKLTPDLVGTFRTATNIVLGSPGYFAPELADRTRGAPAIDRRSDIFSLSAVAYELISHERAWHFNDPWHYVALIQKADVHRPRDLRLLRPEAPVAWSRTIMSGLSKDPRERPSSAGALVRGLAAELPHGEQIIAQRADAIRAASGLPPVARPQLDAPRPPTPAHPAPALRGDTPTAPPAAFAAAVPTLRVDAAADPPNDVEHPSRVSTLTPERIPTFVPVPAPALNPNVIPTLRPATAPRVPTGAIPELVPEAPEPGTQRSEPVVDPATDEAPRALAVVGNLATGGSVTPAGNVESGTAFLDPTLGSPTFEPAGASPPASPTWVSFPSATPAPTTTRPSPTRRKISAIVVTLLALGVVAVLVRNLRSSSSPATQARAPTDVAIAVSIDAAHETMAAVDAAQGLTAPAPVDAAVLADTSVDASVEPPRDAAIVAPETALPPTAPSETAVRERGTVAVYADKPTDVFLSGSHPKFLGTTPLPRASVPSGSVTLELRARGRKTTRKVTIRPGRKTRVDHTWSE